MCDLLQYELVVNPDQQTQVDADNVPVDSLSNPYSVLVQDERVLVADAGANAVLSIDRHSGKISTFFVPPVVTDGACAGAENNPASDKYPATVGCDPVPTGVTTGPGRADLHQHAGRPDPRGGPRVRARPRRHGGASHRRPQPDDRHRRRLRRHHLRVRADRRRADRLVTPDAPAGRIVRIDPDGDRSYAAVPLPQGLAIAGGKLYASALSLVPDGGQVV